jgi:Oxidoreductase molybdopterin binding domain
MQRMDERSLVAASKPELVVLDTPDLNAETPPHLLDDDITPISRLFTRSTGIVPGLTADRIAAWTLTVDGCVRTPRTWTVAALKQEFEPVSVTAVMECAGNGRAYFPQPTSSVLWHFGAVGCATWTGVRLGDLLRHCGLRPEAIYTGHHSPDVNLDDDQPALSRGLPIEKAVAPETLVAYAVNGEPLPLLHGALRCAWRRDRGRRTYPISRANFIIERKPSRGRPPKFVGEVSGNFIIRKKAAAAATLHFVGRPRCGNERNARKVTRANFTSARISCVFGFVVPLRTHCEFNL